MAENEIKISITADGDKAEATLKRVLGALKQVGTEGSKEIKKADLAIASFLGNIAANAASAAISKLGSLLKSAFTGSIAAAIEQEKATQALNTALALTGRYSDDAAKEMDAFASSMQSLTTASDDAILNSAALIQNIARLDKDALKNATKSALDLSAALNIDLQSASSLVAKAMNGNTGALQRYGINVKEASTLSGQHANVLQALARFNGAAEAKTKGFAGAQLQLSNSFGDFQEELGNLITKNPLAVTALGELNKVVKILSDVIKSNAPAIREFFKAFAEFALDYAAIVVKNLEFIYKSALNISIGFQKLKLVYLSTASVFTRGSRESTKAMTDTVDSIAGLEAEIKALQNSANGFDKVVAGIMGVKAAVAGTDVSKASPGNVKTSNVVSSSTDDEAAKAFQDRQKKEIDAVIAKNEALKKLRDDANNDEIAQNNLVIRAKIEASQIEVEEKGTLLLQQQIREQEYNQARVDGIIAINQRLTEEGIGFNYDEVLANEEKLKVILEQETLSAEQRRKIQDQLAAADRKRNEQRLQATSQFFNGLSQLQNTKSRELFEIGKAAAIAQATIDGFLAVQKALASFPPPFNFLAAAGVGVATGVQIAGIASTEFKAATGLTEVPPGFANDTFRARLSSGERVVSAEQNQDLKGFLDDSGGITSRLDTLIEVILNKDTSVSVQVGGETLVDTLQEEIDSGRVLRL